MADFPKRNSDNEYLRAMHSMDLNLLVVLDALLSEGSVAGAARRLNLSSPAVSRGLGRVRKVIGDPILVRAGKRLVPTPLALGLRVRVQALVQEARDLLCPSGEVVPQSIERTFTIRSSDIAVGAAFAARLVETIRVEAPGITLRFVGEGEEDVESLRDGRVDLDIGNLGPTGPEVRTQLLMRDRFAGVVREGHPLLKGKITPKRFVEYPHVSASRRGKARGPIDEALRELGLTRSVTLVVPTAYSALFAVAASDLVAAVPERSSDHALGRLGLRTFSLPVKTEPVEVHQAWHPRLDADPSHRWLRQKVFAAFRKASAGDSAKGEQ
ncbi:LysR family transcriptional regulator [Singulisphaera sp. PoT]|uniref:LysR family transcriptional regulator n=1 Tax=Singulisphaera sp. PoT TaxID=3411797 RepID=UPI003BF52232